MFGLTSNNLGQAEVGGISYHFYDGVPKAKGNKALEKAVMRSLLELLQLIQ